ncbi:MAG: tripartite tricarboxylate transporter substrate binding protein [Betaproteobacteria bacterium]|jgi:tripartite-type tricarboxylate transporter receptor subunit TctC
MRWINLVLALFVSLLNINGVCADTYPNKPVTIIVPLAPGGISDMTARPLAAALGQVMGQNFIIENRPGAGGAIGAAYAANQKPDGYKLLVALTSMLVIPEAEKVAGKQPSYELSQFIPIAKVAADPVILLVRADSPWKTLDDLIKDAKSRPGNLSYSSSGLYGAIHMPMEMLSQAAAIKLIHVPYQSGGQSMIALLGGQVDMTIQAPGVASQHLKAGKIRVLASFGNERTKNLAEVPTLKELGYDVEFFIWSSMFAPAGTPADIILKLRTAVKQAITEPVFVNAMAGMSAPVAYQDAPELQIAIDNESKRLATIVKRIGKID